MSTDPAPTSGAAMLGDHIYRLTETGLTLARERQAAKSGLWQTGVLT